MMCKVLLSFSRKQISDVLLGIFYEARAILCHGYEIHQLATDEWVHCSLYAEKEKEKSVMQSFKKEENYFEASKIPKHVEIRIILKVAMNVPSLRCHDAKIDDYS